VRPSRSATRVKLRLADSVALRIASDLARLAVAEPDPAFWSPINNQRRETEALAALTTFATR